MIIIITIIIITVIIIIIIIIILQIIEDLSWSGMDRMGVEAIVSHGF